MKCSVAIDAAPRRGRPAHGRRAQAGQQLVHAERLRDVVVGAGVERGDLVALAAPRRQDDDRHLRPTAQPVDDVEAVHPGQAEVEQDDVRVVAGGELQRLLAPSRRGRRRTRGPEVGGEGPTDRRLVVDDQDPRHGTAPDVAAAR